MRVETPDYFQTVTIQGNVVDYGGKFILRRYPTDSQDVANKEYVDNVASSLTSDYVYKVSEVINLLQTHEEDTSVHLTPSQNTLLDNLNVGYTEINQLSGVSGNIQQQINSKVNRTGDTFTGLVSMSVEPINAQNLTTKNYVDNGYMSMKAEMDYRTILTALALW